MTIRARVALTTGLVVATAILVVSAIAWLVTRHNLRSELDQTLLGRFPPPGAVIDGVSPPDFDLLCQFTDTGQSLQRFLERTQLLRQDGSVCAPSKMDEVVTTAGDLAVTAVVLRDGTTVAGVPVRVLLYPLGDGRVLLLSRSLTDVDESLSQLRDTLILASLLGVVLAGIAGLLLTRAALAPMERLTATAEHIARTEDLETPVDVSGRDEVGRLGRAFTAMTVALSDARKRQRDLIADAAHELRTPLTSLRTNIELLARSEQLGRPLPAEHRTKIMTSLRSQSGEFGELVMELLTLARDERELRSEDVELVPVIERAVRRARSRAGGHHFEVGSEPWTVVGDPAALERVVLNLLDNAVKFSPAGSTITITTAPGWITVCDQGPGIPVPRRKQVFDRFWRAPEARGMPGSGLGLAIVAGTVTAHGGTVAVVDPPEGQGTCVRVELPVSYSPARPRGG